MSKTKKEMYEIDRATRKARRVKARHITRELTVTHKDGREETANVNAAVSIEQAEARQIVGTLASEFLRRLDFYKSPMHGELSHNDAVKQADQTAAFKQEQIAHAPLQQIDWGELAALAEVSLSDSLKLWGRVREAADDELMSGRRAAHAIGGARATAWTLAQYLAIRDSFADALQPKDGFESAMVDMLTGLWSLYMYWQGLGHQRAVHAHDAQTKALEQYANMGWPSPYQREADAIEQAHKMAGSYLHQFLKVQRALRDWRRHMPPVIVNQAGGQVNVAAGQQVNVSK